MKKLLFCLLIFIVGSASAMRACGRDVEKGEVGREIGCDRGVFRRCNILRKVFSLLQVSSVDGKEFFSWWHGDQGEVVQSYCSERIKCKVD